MEFLELGYFKPIHLMMIILIPIIFALIYLPLKNKSKKTTKIALLTICIVNAGLYISYKFAMAFTYDTFILLNELPLHLCNLNLILMPIALLSKKEKFKNLLFGYFIFVGCLAALCGVLFFDSCFKGKNTLSYVVLIYFIYHCTLFILPIVFVALGFYKPKLNDIWKSLLILFTLALIMHMLNLIFINAGICKEANYFYTMGMPDNPVLGMMQKLIPIPLLYLVPIAPILYIIDVIIALPFHFYVKKKQLKILNI